MQEVQRRRGEIPVRAAVHPPEQVVCPQCGQEFTRIRTVGALRIYCSRKCTFAAGEERKLKRNADLGPRRCACGAEVTTRVGKPVCPSCRKDPRGTEQLQAKERRRTLALYGLSQEQWDRLIALQGNRCAVCKPPSLAAAVNAGTSTTTT
jgi:hypothetical protein